MFINLFYNSSIPIYCAQVHYVFFNCADFVALLSCHMPLTCKFMYFICHS